MDILKNKDILDTKRYLQDKMNPDTCLYENEIKEIKHSVKNWKFATDEMYSPIPFFHELNKFKKGKILKFSSVDEALKKENTFTFGFSCNEKLLMTQKSNAIKAGIDHKIYNYKNNTIEYFLMRIYMDKAFKNKLISAGTLSGIENNLQFDINVQNNGQNWSATVYEYMNNMINKVYRYSKGWNGQTEYKFEYENEILKKIKIGNIDWWKK
ncbi:MAG: hypothetical protein LBJ88_00185 [Campylobacteraceae bacterium]|jgi:hypothetical protein|nr:hypothetical protein [Campylobacteraceae bacterium]